MRYLLIGLLVSACWMSDQQRWRCDPAMRQRVYQRYDANRAKGMKPKANPAPRTIWTYTPWIRSWSRH